MPFLDRSSQESIWPNFTDGDLFKDFADIHRGACRRGFGDAVMAGIIAKTCVAIRCPDTRSLVKGFSIAAINSITHVRP